VNYYDQLDYRSQDWYFRVKIAGDIIRNNQDFEFVYDFGCGDGVLRFIIPSSKKYFGYDGYKRFDGVNIIDFNGDPFPNIVEGSKHNRICVCLGFFEYIINIADMITNIADNFDYLIFSYVPIHKKFLKKNDKNRITYSSLDFKNIITKKFKFLDMIRSDKFKIYIAAKNKFKIIVIPDYTYTFNNV
jgi:hypothetical protein